MLKLPITRRTITLGAAAVALAGGLTLATGGAAFADSGSADLSTANCGGYAAWNTNQAWGSVYSKNGTYCLVSISQNGGSVRSYGTTGGYTTTMPYWRGWSSAGPYLHDRVCVTDYASNTARCIDL
ncbi:hypothetical protein GCM10010441_07600 [Kitasatospora paracochleata]|uniref:Peptidase inhibitor family I36 n=1 Tax=Kitasatospora paracochleata TaxID=58354 RepID=A0ABT1J7T4_9ACTN|nr:hypothetical protein [Kitasatospora paracochleata]MCP2313458.1 hypothetical protein [Kitasatospora paracochleata]